MQTQDDKEVRQELKPNEYRCCVCGGVFEKGWSDEEAVAEAVENFGFFDADAMELVCDDCFNAPAIGEPKL